MPRIMSGRVNAGKLKLPSTSWLPGSLLGLAGYSCEQDGEELVFLEFTFAGVSGKEIKREIGAKTGRRSRTQPSGYVGR